MNNHKYAGIWIRTLAGLVDLLIGLLPLTLLLLLSSQSQNFNHLIQTLVYFFAIWGLPSTILWPLFLTLTTFYLGGTVGKLLTGLKVIPDEKVSLSLKRLFFRHTTGYAFSGILFGLGYLSIIKDPQKQAWHDKATGTKVIITSPILWILGLLMTLFLLGLHGYLFGQSVKNFTNTPLKNDFVVLTNSFQETMEKLFQEEEKTLKTIQPSIPPEPSPSSKAPSSTVQSLNYTPEDQESWKQEIDYLNQDLNTLQGFYNSNSYDKSKLDQVKNLINQRKAIAERIYNKMVKKQSLTNQDFNDIQTYDQLTTQQQKLNKEVFGT